MKQEDPSVGLKKQMSSSGQDDHTLGYACISSEGGTVQVMHLTNLSAELTQLSGLDTESEVLGLYEDLNLSLYYVLT